MSPDPDPDSGSRPESRGPQGALGGLISRPPLKIFLFRPHCIYLQIVQSYFLDARPFN